MLNFFAGPYLDMTRQKKLYWQRLNRNSNSYIVPLTVNTNSSFIKSRTEKCEHKDKTISFIEN